MLARFLADLHRQWMAALALFLVLSGGVAYAADTVFSSDIVDGEVKSVDIGTNQVRGVDVRNDTLGRRWARRHRRRRCHPDRRRCVADESLAGVDVAEGGLTGADVADRSIVGSTEIGINTLTGNEVGPNSIDSDEVTDFALSNRDVGVLYAVVNQNGTLARSSGGITSAHLGGFQSGTYEVDFGHNVATCAGSATLGQPGSLPIGAGMIGIRYENDDPEDMTVHIHNADGAGSDGPFHLVAVAERRAAQQSARNASVGVVEIARDRRSEQSGIWGRPSARHARYCVGDVAGEVGRYRQAWMPSTDAIWTRSWHSPTPEWSGFPRTRHPERHLEGHDGTREWWTTCSGSSRTSSRTVWVREAGNLAACDCAINPTAKAAPPPLMSRCGRSLSGAMAGRRWQMYAIQARSLEAAGLSE